MPDPPPPAGNGSSAAQDQIEAVGASILADVQANGYPGFSGLVAAGDGGSPTLDLYWQEGEVLPPDVAAIVADPGQPVTVARMNATCGKVYLDSRADALMNAPDTSGQICGLMHTIIVPEEGTGLNVQAQPYDGVDQTAFASQAAAVLSQIAAVPVQVTIAPLPTQTGRQDDHAPWWGGARITSPGLGRCSDGFGVVRTVGTKTTQYMLSAAHCFGPGDNVFNGVAAGVAGNAQIGTVADFLPGFDSELIQAPLGVRPAVFTDVWDGGGFISPVNKTGVNIKGLLMFVCASGASTGQNCLLNVTDTDVRIFNWWLSITLRKFQWSTNLVTAQAFFFRNVWRGTAIGQGDSGGPVIQYTAEGSAQAMGTIVAGKGVVPCGAVAPGISCFGTVYYADINNLLKVYGAGLAQ